MKNIDIRQMPDVCDKINAVLNNRGIVELKQESTGITVVEIKRTLKR